jgi:RNA polymerase sigma factor for flagellar operon FliA
MLPAQEEAGLSGLWTRFTQARDLHARSALIECYMPLARSTAARLFSARIDDSIPFDDYLQYARLGLVEAIDRYDPAREASFETFSSYRIRGAILNGLGKESELTAQRGYWRTRTQERIDSLKPGAFEGGEGELDDFVQIAVGLAIGVLLDETDDELPDESPRANPYAAAELSELRRIVRSAVDELSDRESDVIRRHYFGQWEFQMIARELGITKGRVSQLHAQALARIRRVLAARPGVDFNL